MKTKIPWKQWLYEQAEREGRTAAAVQMRFYHGFYPGLKRRYTNKRVIFVHTCIWHNSNAGTEP
jgi:hypothetical protein